MTGVQTCALPIFSIKTPDNEEVSEDSILATNQTIEFADVKVQCKIVVTGDVTGDGKITLADILKLNEYRLDSTKELTNAEFLAGNVVNTDDEIDMRDVLKLNEFRLSL